MNGYIAALSSADVLAELAEQNADVVVLSQDFGPIGAFTARFPERHFDLGISEQNLVGVAAGLAHAGKVAFVLAMACSLPRHGPLRTTLPIDAYRRLTGQLSAVSGQL